MSLTSALNTALSGLRFVETNLDVVARNVVNADTPGYTRKTQVPVSELLAGQVGSIRPGAIERDVNTFLQQQLRTEGGLASMFDVRNAFLDRLDQLFGTPGEANAFDSIVNGFGQSLQELASNPDQFGVRDQVIAESETVAAQLNRLSTEIQQMRREAEARIAEAVKQANIAMQEIARLNEEIAVLDSNAIGTAGIQDERDRFIDQLSRIMDIRVAEGDRGVVRVFTTSGNLLVGTQAARLSFDEHASLDPAAQYSRDDAERGVGTLVLSTLSGSKVDLFKGDTLRAGTIAAYRELRDETLVTAQAQLDEFAHGLALALSTRTVAGQPVSAGAQAGFDLDVAGLLAGNEVEVTFTQTPPGTPQTFTFVRVDDPANLPLGDDVTANPDDTVVGIDFSGGFAAAVAAMDAALGPDISVSSPVADTIRILDDGAAGTVSIDAAAANVTSTVISDEGLQLPLFVDVQGSVMPYSASMDGTPQKLGFAQRITVNPAVAADNTTLVVHSTSPATGIGDPARPIELLERFSERLFSFHPESGMGQTGSPLSVSVAGFAQRLVSFQGGAAENARRASDAQAVVFETLQERFKAETGVVVDEEMSRLLDLENAYAANARVMTAVQELIEILRQI